MKSCSASTRRISIVVSTSLLIAWLNAYGSAPDCLQITADPDTLTVHRAARPIAQYRYGDAPFKPYLKELYTPAGRNVLLDSPHDHVHHHGLMFALEIEGVDYWGETQTPACGIQQHTALTDLDLQPQTACFNQTIKWIAPKAARPTAVEQRTIRLHSLKDEDVTLLTWSTRLHPAPDRPNLTITGRHYFGLGMRFVRAMDRTGAFFNSDNNPGKVVRGDERLTPSRWCAYSAEIDGKPVTVAMFDLPANPRHPATWFTMKDPFAYVAATLALNEQPLTLNAGSTLDLTYGVALWDGATDASAIEALYKKWVALNTR